MGKNKHGRRRNGKRPREVYHQDEYYKDYQFGNYQNQFKRRKLIEDSQPCLIPLENKFKAEQMSQNLLHSFLQDKKLYQMGRDVSPVGAEEKETPPMPIKKSNKSDTVSGKENKASYACGKTKDESKAVSNEVSGEKDKEEPEFSKTDTEDESSDRSFNGELIVLDDSTMTETDGYTVITLKDLEERKTKDDCDTVQLSETSSEKTCKTVTDSTKMEGTLKQSTLENSQKPPSSKGKEPCTTTASKVTTGRKVLLETPKHPNTKKNPSTNVILPLITIAINPAAGRKVLLETPTSEPTQQCTPATTNVSTGRKVLLETPKSEPTQQCTTGRKVSLEAPQHPKDTMKNPTPNISQPCSTVTTNVSTGPKALLETPLQPKSKIVDLRPVKTSCKTTPLSAVPRWLKRPVSMDLPTPASVRVINRSSKNLKLETKGSRRQHQRLVTNVVDKKDLKVKYHHVSSPTVTPRVTDIDLTPGKEYEIRHFAVEEKDTPTLENRKKVTSGTQLSIRAEFNLGEITQLYEKAERFIRQTYTKTYPISYFYRNKPVDYYEHIFNEQWNVMHPHLKDHCGSAASVINGKLKGLFFSGRVDLRTKQLPAWSPFGEQRLHILAQNILNWKINLYFADFYCISFIHYIIIVVSRKGSEADRFCRDNLQPLKLERNNILYRSPGNNVVFVANSKEINVEVFYTEDVDINQELQMMGFFSKVSSHSTAKRSGTLTKNKRCSVCNI